MLSAWPPCGPGSDALFTCSSPNYIMGTIKQWLWYHYCGKLSGLARFDRLVAERRGAAPAMAMLVLTQGLAREYSFAAARDDREHA
jgi:hypothetical protein